MEMVHQPESKYCRHGRLAWRQRMHTSISELNAHMVTPAGVGMAQKSIPNNFSSYDIIWDE